MKPISSHSIRRSIHRTVQRSINPMVLTLLVVLGHAFAEPGKITLTPSQNDTRGPVLNVIKPFEVRLETNINAAKTATMSLIRGGRPVGGEIPLQKNGNAWTGKAKLEFPGAHILTVRLFEGKRIWSAAIDTTALEAEAKPFPAGSSATQDLDFSVTEGKAGGDTNGLWGILALVLLAVGVFLATRNAKKPVRFGK
jgi:hypothetical protein